MKSGQVECCALFGSENRNDMWIHDIHGSYHFLNIWEGFIPHGSLMLSQSAEGKTDWWSFDKSTSSLAFYHKWVCVKVACPGFHWFGRHLPWTCHNCCEKSKPFITTITFTPTTINFESITITINRFKIIGKKSSKPSITIHFRSIFWGFPSGFSHAFHPIFQRNLPHPGARSSLWRTSDPSRWPARPLRPWCFP